MSVGVGFGSTESSAVNYYDESGSLDSTEAMEWEPRKLSQHVLA